MSGIDRRAKAYHDIVSAMPKRDPAIEEVIDGEEYRYLPEPRCRTCSASDPRKGLPNGYEVGNLVDSLLLYPKSMADIYRTIEPMMAEWPAKSRITYKSIRTHLNEHLAWDRKAARMMVERWAHEKGLSVMDASGRMLLTEEAWLEHTIQTGWQKIISGQIEPSWAEVQKAFERMGAIREQAEGEYSVSTLLAQLNTIIDVVRDFIPTNRMDEFIARIEEHEDRPALPPPAEATEEFDEIINEQHKFAAVEE